MTTELDETFSALADPTRRAVVGLLREGPRRPSELADALSLSRPAISRHLKVLRQAGLVEQRIQGTSRLYSVRAQALRSIADWTLDHRAFWEASMDRLATHLALQDGD